MTTLKPINGIIAIRLDKREESQGGIALLNEEKLHYGTILATGPGEYKQDGEFRPVRVEPGQRIVIAPGAGVELDIDGVGKLTFMVQDDIVGIINDKNEVEDV